MRAGALARRTVRTALGVDSKPLGGLDIHDTLEALFRAGTDCHSTTSTAYRGRGSWSARPAELGTTAPRVLSDAQRTL
ncbi:hypothetical protein [Sinorhizobium terangae]|uniref:hypothetical protein n=1 Tax=Sinorhizobium terangae TaxID=110322 RepID=UPI0024B22740|nr:hypothetical protein [Sinorhizobium terangae]WFU50398.1 hypothetical protein QA637_26940 [Sinorhizobium terangae]